MKPKTTLNPKNLQALGAKRLAELLVEISSGDPVAGRRLRLELAGAQSAGELGREVRKRINTLARSRSFVDWQGIRALAEDLDTQRAAIVKMAKADPKDALDLLWKFMGLAPAVFERCDDSNGRVMRLSSSLQRHAGHCSPGQSRSGEFSRSSVRSLAGQ